MRGDTKIMIGVFVVIAAIAVVEFSRDETGHYEKQFRENCIAGSGESTVSKESVAKICDCAATAMVRNYDAKTLDRINDDPELNTQLVEPVMKQCVETVMNGHVLPMQ